MKDQNRRNTAIIIGITAIFLFVFSWSLIAAYVNSPYLPEPQRVFATLTSILIQDEKDFSGFRISQHISASMIRVFSGFGIAAVMAIPIGLLTGRFWHIEKAASPIVEIIRPIPPLAWIPFAIYFFRDPGSSVFIVAIGAIFPILLSTAAGVKSIDSVFVDAARTLGAKRLDVFRKVIIPASVPSIMTGLRIGLGVGWMCVVAAELVGVKNGGLGVYIMLMSDVGRFENVFAGMIIVGFLGFVMVTIMTYVERRLSRWAGMT
jgi:NitT/TauT family transport system permease protein